jgi:molybdate transport system ATP-binding protein
MPESTERRLPEGGAAQRVPAVLEIDLALPLDRFRLEVRAQLCGRAAVLGPSGAGKTSLVEALAGLRRAAGRVVLSGRELQGGARGWLPPERRRIGYVPQDGALFPHLTVRGNLLFGARGAARRGAELEAVAASLGLEPLLGRRPRHLSGGERRLVALGRALLADRDLLLLDEPTAGLDPARARRALGVIRRTLERWPMPLLVVTHRQEEALALADEIVLLEEGKVVAAGGVVEVLRSGVLLEAGSARIENVRVARVVEHLPAAGVSRVRLASGEEMLAPLLEGLAPGHEVVLTVAAEEVMVTLEAVPSLSARNALRGEVTTLVEVAGGGVLVEVAGWLAHLTRGAVQELGLAPGRVVLLVVKSHSWRQVAQ